MKTIKIPQSGSEKNTDSVEITKNLVIVGANGAGKTRFGSRLEQINNQTKRISAQRYLQLDEVIQKQDYETSKAALKSTYKNRPPVEPQNDYQKVLIALFAEEASRNEDVISLINSNGQITKKEMPSSIKEKLIEIWNFIFPYRSLKLEKDRVRADDFSGTELSDGEKVGLYLISQILLAEKESVFIIDEPELHLHKALMVRLWNKLEESRSDCTFVYITHDLDFAVTKPTSKIIWIQSFKNSLWNWKEIDPNEIIPENLFLEILGSRKPILLVEGDKGSLDIQIYQVYYENFTIIPCGSCEKVIEAVRGLKEHLDLHDKKVFGLIDRDFRTNDQLTALISDGIFSIALNEVENLFLLPEMIEVVCDHLSKADKKGEVISEIKLIYAKNKANLHFKASKYRMHRHLNEKFGAVKNEAEFNEFKVSICSELDDIRSNIELPDDQADILEILKIYPHKGLAKGIQHKLELSKNGYKNLVLSFLLSEKRKKLIDILQPYLPEIAI